MCVSPHIHIYRKYAELMVGTSTIVVYVGNTVVETENG